MPDAVSIAPNATLPRAADAHTLPPLVQRYLERAILRDCPVPAHVRVVQTGQMWRRPGAKPMRFTAIEEFAVDTVAFSWRARFAVAPLLALTIHDGCADGDAWMRGRFAGFSFVNTGGPDVIVGAAMRYLAEIAWAPHAMMANREIAWREVDAQSVESVIDTSAGRAAIVLGFDDHADIISARAEARPRDGDQPRPWQGTFGDYVVMDGIRVPTTAEVRWVLPEGPFTYFRCTVTDLTLITREDQSL